ncbi:MAG: c-type cytochrome biogenesis protein CcmI [Robiginitomaculum sp.]
MIWILAAILILATLLFALNPLYAAQTPAAKVDSEVQDYQNQIERLTVQIAQTPADIEVLKSAKLDLQRQLLSKTNDESVRQSKPSLPLIVALFAFFGTATFSLYMFLGQPTLTKEGALIRPIITLPNLDTATSIDSGEVSENGETLEKLIAQMETVLAKNKYDTQGWLLYARSLMRVQRYDDALSAYQNVLVLTGKHPKVVEEFLSAKRYIVESQTKSAKKASAGPSEQEIQAAAKMSPQERQAMIEGMVDGLSQKLIENPKNVNGWIKLLKSRKALSQEDKAKTEIARMSEAFKNDPKTAKTILTQSGWK